MKNNIVVIEDNANSLSSKINVDNYNTIPVTTIDLNNILDLQPAIVLLDDLALRRVGNGFCRSLKDSSVTNIPVLLISNHPNIKDLAHVCGADDYLRRPFSNDQLIKKISSLVQ